MKPKVSIITPAYNAERFIDETVQSVLLQSYSNWELLLICDVNSKDKTAEIAAKWAREDSRILAMHGPAAGGVIENRNFALEKASGEYIAFLDADDIWLADKLTQQVDLMISSNATLSYTAYQHIDESGKLLPRKVIPPLELTFKDLLADNPIGCLTAMVKADVAKKIKFKNIGAEDFGFWLDILREKNCRAAGLQQILAKYRIVHGSRSNNKLRAAKMRWATMRGVAKLNFIATVFYMTRYTYAGIVKHKRII